MPTPATPRRWGLIVITDATGGVSHIWLAGEGAPDMGTIDEMAQMLRGARRDGRHARLEQVAPEMAELIELSGLGREVDWKPERGE
jgi:hypothetical protein